MVTFPHLFSKSLFLIVCGLWSFSSVVSSVSLWTDRDFSKCLDPPQDKKKKSVCISLSLLMDPVKKEGLETKGNICSPLLGNSQTRQNAQPHSLLPQSVSLGIQAAVPTATMRSSATAEEWGIAVRSLTCSQQISAVCLHQVLPWLLSVSDQFPQFWNHWFWWVFVPASWLVWRRDFELPTLPCPWCHLRSFWVNFCI